MATKNLSATQKASKKSMNLNELREFMFSPLFAIHTRLFADRIGWDSALLRSVKENDVVAFSKESNQCTMDDLKELKIIATILASQAIIDHLHVDRKCTLDIDTLNIALLSGQFVGKKLDQFISKQIRPTYNSIRYAVKSGNVDVLKDVLDRYDLKPGNEHLITAAAMVNRAMFLELIERGSVPEGDDVYLFAAKPGNTEIQNILHERFNKQSAPSMK